MKPQAMKQAVAVMFNNQPKALLPCLLVAMKPKRPNNAVKRTATYGTPCLFVLLRTLGAIPASAKPYKIREPQ